MAKSHKTKQIEPIKKVKTFDFYVSAPLIIPINKKDVRVTVGFYGKFETINNIPFHPIPTEYKIEKAEFNGKELSIKDVGAHVENLWINNFQRMKEVVLKEINIFALQCSMQGRNGMNFRF